MWRPPMGSPPNGTTGPQVPQLHSCTATQSAVSSSQQDQPLALRYIIPVCCSLKLVYPVLLTAKALMQLPFHNSEHILLWSMQRID
jgi:hypothetical protein